MPEPQKHSSGLQALQVGQQLTDDKLIEVAKAWGAVQQQAKARSADPAYIESVEKHSQRIESLKGGRIHEFARQNVSANFNALACDSRFSEHDDATLTKAAYFRGVHQKRSEFQGESADLAHYDKTVADCNVARRLPAFDEVEQRRTVQEATRSALGDDGLSL